MESRYQRFLQFDFEASSEWKAYISSIDPPPTGQQIFLLKKRFFKRKIDPEFDINYIANSSNNGQSASDNSRANQNQSAPQSSQNAVRSDLGILVYSAEILVYFYFFIMLFLSNDNVFSYLMYGLAIRNLRLNWPVKFNKEYLANLLSQDCFSYLVYSVIMYFSTSDDKVFVYSMHSVITCFVYICGFQRRNSLKFPTKITSIFAKIREYQHFYIKTRNFLELLTLPTSIMGIFLGFNSLFLPFLYYKFLKMRLCVDPKLTSCLDEIKLKLTTRLSLTSNQLITSFLQKLISCCDNLKE